MRHGVAPLLGRPSSALIAPGPMPRRSQEDLLGLPTLLATVGPLELRLAGTRRDVARAQRLRFRVFFEDGAATPSIADARQRRDRCPFDAEADHLLVVDTAFLTATGRRKSKVVGTYRLLRSDTAARGQGFYSGTEFDLGPLLQRQAGLRLLELGRSCVDPRYRGRRVINLLWRGIGMYAAHHRIDALIGCASLPGVDLALLQAPLSFLGHHAAANAAWRVEPLPGRGIRWDRLQPDDIRVADVLATLPPLVKAYLRAGSRFSLDPVVDHAFGCTDLFAVLPLAGADRHYLAHFAAPLA